MHLRKKATLWFKSRSTRQQHLLIAGTSVCILICAYLLAHLNESYLATIPDAGGSFTEGIIGVPRFINPLLAISDADRDLTTLVYSGLMAVTGDGSLVPDLAESYSVSDDGTIYTFTLRENLVFHDKTPLTADDVVFTITLAQDDVLKSPKRPNWEGVTVSSPDPRTIVFTLTEPFTPFLKNTTLGILPKHLWDLDSSDLISFSNHNSLPIGSGPFKVTIVERDANGIPQTYTLKSFDKYARGKPHLDTVQFKFFTEYDKLYEAFNRGAVDNIHSIPPALITDPDLISQLKVLPLARTFGVFFNQDTQPLFTNGSIRRALNASIDRNQLVTQALRGYAAPITTPLPATKIPTILPTSTDTFISNAQQILVDANWEINEESGTLEREFDGELEVGRFTLATVDIPELIAVAEYLKSTWVEIGIDVTIETYPITELNQQIIRPRAYDALLFGQVLQAPHDLFAFWHSSQRNDPGLNVALYANITADAALSELRSTRDTDIQTRALETFYEEVDTDTPAIFLYTPSFIYTAHEKIKGQQIQNITKPSDRFTDIHKWYRYTQKVWRLFN